MTTLTYSAPEVLAASARRAAQQWNRALEGLCVLRHGVGYQVEIVFGKVNRVSDPNRVAQFGGKNIKAKYPDGRITLADDRKWRTWPAWQFWRSWDEDATAALIHEFGHALGYGHSQNYSDVMHPRLGSTVISREEEAWLRENFKPALT